MDQELHYICCWGELDKLIKYDKNKLNEGIIQKAINYMKSKLQEIEVWETEDQNQDPKTLESFAERSLGIQQCIGYLSNLPKVIL